MLIDDHEPVLVPTQPLGGAVLAIAATWLVITALLAFAWACL